MAVVEVLVPQLGEGLREVRIISLLKKPGDNVRRDEIIYTMETDKALVDVESPYEGVLGEWLAGEGDVLPIGAPVASVEPTNDVSAPVVPASRAGALSIPPRTRAYAREHGLSDADLAKVPVGNGKLMPSDIDAYLAEIAGDVQAPAYTETTLNAQQKKFIYHLRRSLETVVPGVIKMRMSWPGIFDRANELRDPAVRVHPTPFQTLAYCVVQACQSHPRFRSVLVGDEVIREYSHLNLGIAVGKPDGQLTTAVVSDAGTLTFPNFISTLQKAIGRARRGEDQADGSVQLHLTYMGSYDVYEAIPVLVAPAAAVLFIGSTFDLGGVETVNLVLTFDHRLIHGIEAARFLQTIKAIIENGLPKPEGK